MSEYFTHVVSITNVTKHPAADSLEIIRVYGTADDPTSGYPAIARLGTFKVGDLALYCSVDAMVPLSNPLFSFLRTKPTQEFVRISAKRLRGVFSMGLLTAAPEGSKEGDNLGEALGIKKYEPQVNHFGKGGSNQDIVMKGNNVSDPGCVPVYDLEGIRKFSRIFEEGQVVEIVEKINGCNIRVGYIDTEFYVGSRRFFKARDENNDFWRVAIALDLEEKLKPYPNMIFWGELLGGVGDMRYGRPKGSPTIAFFDIYDVKAQKFLDFTKMKEIVEGLGLMIAPIVYEGPFNKALAYELAEKDSIYPGANHLAEGVVIRYPDERIDPATGQRCILKLVGNRYHLR